MLANSQAVPRLNTTFTEPLKYLERHLLAQRKVIEQWFAEQWLKTAPPVYGSVDLRNAGFKLAPIDMNLFPAGFNNLNPEFKSISVTAAKKVIHQIVPDAKNILIIPESHTRNLFYWANIHTLQNMLEEAGFAVRFGILSPDVTTAQDIELPSGDKVRIEPLQREDDNLHVDGFVPDMTLLNNDLSDGIPDILQTSQSSTCASSRTWLESAFKVRTFSVLFRSGS